MISTQGIKSALTAIFLFAIVLVLVGFCSKAFALPTPFNSKLTWVHPGAADLSGFFVYWRAQGSQSVFTDSQKYDLPAPNAREVLIIDFNPTASGGLCFVITAYDVAGNESGFSNEACGFFGITAPSNLQAVP